MFICRVINAQKVCSYEKIDFKKKIAKILNQNNYINEIHC